MKNVDHLGYDEATDRFSVEQCNQADENLFMSMDELCSPVRPQHVYEKKTEQNAPKAEAMESVPGAEDLFYLFYQGSMVCMQLSMLLDHKTKAIMRRMWEYEQTHLLDKEMHQ